MSTPTKTTPNPKIDKALEKMLSKIDEQPLDVAVKVINSAMTWERIKHNITENDNVFDPDNL